LSNTLDKVYNFWYIDLNYQSRAIKVELQDEKMPTVSIHDLIELKLRAGRKQDLADVEHLRMVLGR
jgi:predicted nucleotidyltransferase